MSKHFTLPFGPLPYHSDPIDYTGDSVLGIYAVETTQRYIYGTRMMTWDGRVYKYANAVAQVYSYWGAHAYENAAVSYTAVPSATPLGGRSCTVTVASRAEDDLAGGYLVTFDNSATTTTFMHGIVGNDATVSTTTVVHLDSPMPVLTTTSDYNELFENPYRETKAHAAGVCPVVCVPANSAGAGYKYWGQTWGPAYISPTNSTIDDPTAGELQTYFTGSGTTGGLVEGAIGSSENQHAGFILNSDIATGGGIAGPFIMLQISV